MHEVGTQNSRKEIRLIAPLHNYSGYAKAGRGFLAALLHEGFTVEAIECETRGVQSIVMKEDALHYDTTTVPLYAGTAIHPIQEAELKVALRTKVAPDAPTIILQPPNKLSEHPEFNQGARIGITMIEGTDFPDIWKTPISGVDTLLVPCVWNADVMNTHTEKKVGVLPLCVDERLWDTSGPVFDKSTLGASKLFFALFSTCERKQWRQMMQAFAEEFRGEDVALLVKPTRVAEVEEMAEWCRKMGANIHVATSYWSDAFLASVYRAADFYVLPATEGFGMPYVESMLCGTPCIALDEGAAADIVNESNGYSIPSFTGNLRGHMPHLYPSNAVGQYAGVDMIKHTMRRAMDEGKEIKSRQARIDAYARFGRKTIGMSLEKVARLSVSTRRLSACSGRWAESIDLMEFACVITTKNQWQQTRRLLDSLHDHTWDYCKHVVIVDDGSEDSTVQNIRDIVDTLSSRKTTISVIETPTGNPGRNRQKGTEHMKSVGWDGYVVFMDNDIQVTAGWWKAISDLFGAYPEVGIIGPTKIYSREDLKGKTQDVGMRVSTDGDTRPNLLSRELTYVDYVDNACMCVSPDVWKRVSYDPQFSLWYDDADYCFQARYDYGFEVGATGNATVLHHAHATSQSRLHECDRNRKKFLVKWKENL